MAGFDIWPIRFDEEAPNPNQYSCEPKLPRIVNHFFGQLYTIYLRRPKTAMHPHEDQAFDF